MLFSIYLNFYNTQFFQIYTGSGEYCKLLKTLIRNIGHRVSFKDRFEKLTLEGSVFDGLQLP